MEFDRQFWKCTGFTGHWPVPTAAVMFAGSRACAVNALNRALKKQGLPGKVVAADLEPLGIETETFMRDAQVVILSNGDY